MQKPSGPLIGSQVSGSIRKSATGWRNFGKNDGIKPTAPTVLSTLTVNKVN